MYGSGVGRFGGVVRGEVVVACGEVTARGAEFVTDDVEFYVRVAVIETESMNIEGCEVRHDLYGAVIKCLFYLIIIVCWGFGGLLVLKKICIFALALASPLQAGGSYTYLKRTFFEALPFRLQISQIRNH